MSSSSISLTQILSNEEIASIDAFAAENTGEASLPAWSEFLEKNFSTGLALDPDIVEGFVNDSSNLPGSASAVARPETEKQCAAVMRACHKGGIRLTISGGRSNLTGSATPEGGVILSVAKMLNPEVAVDEAAKTVLAPVGMILEEMRKDILAKTGGKLFFPLDPTSRADAWVGGAVACNASGFIPGESGASRQWVEGINFILPNGMMVKAARGDFISEGGKFILDDGSQAIDWPIPRYTRPTIKNAGGPFSSPEGGVDFIDLIIGSEGIFGLITACTLKLNESPSEYLDLFFSLPTEADAIKCRNAISEKTGGNLGSLSALEYFGVNSRKYMDHEERLFLGDNQVGVYVQVPLTEGQDAEEVAMEWLETLMEADCGVDEDAVMLLDNDRDRAVFMEARHSMPANALEVVQHHGTFTIMTDTVVPDEKFPEFLDYTHNLINSEGMQYLAFGHLGDCHLHFTILPTKEQLQRATEVYEMIVAKSAELGGVYSGEHGTGKRKRKDFLKCYGPEAAEDVLRSKAALDPQYLLNFNNVVEMPCA